MFNRFHQYNKPYPPSTDGHDGDLEASHPKGKPAHGADMGNLSEHIATGRLAAIERTAPNRAMKILTLRPDGSRDGVTPRHCS
jgi:hypothetical protein